MRTFWTMHEKNSHKIGLWNKLSEKKIGDYKIFRTFCCEFENERTGQSGDFYLIKCCNWVQVIAETEDKKLVMVKQFRFGSEEISLELPGGVIEDGESPLEAAKRELAEETGFCSEYAEVIATLYPNPAIQTNVVYAVLMTGCKKEKSTDFDEFEDLETHILSKDEVIDAVKTGEISHCIPIAALAKYLKLR